MVGMIVPGGTGWRDVCEVIQNFCLQNICVHRVGRLSNERIQLFMIVLHRPFADFLRPFVGQKFLGGIL